MIDGKTVVCGIIGDPVEHTLSPAMHNAAYQALGLNWVYIAFRVRDVAAAAAGIRGLSLRGVSVTLPHKVSVIPYLDEVEPVARWIGAVNTILNEDGRLIGLNTDGAGAMKALTDAGVTLGGSRVLLLGSGGAARAIALTLAARAGIADLMILGIIPEEMKKLAADVSEKTGVPSSFDLLSDTSLAAALEGAQVVIHCTPVGMHPHEEEVLVPAELWRPGFTFMDIVYNPRETRMLREARAAGVRVIPGLEMLLNQGVLQFEIWTGQNAPQEVMRQALEAGLAR